MAIVFFLIFVLPVLVDEAPPVWTGGGLAVFAGAYAADRGRQKKHADGGTVTLEPLSTAHLSGL